MSSMHQFFSVNHAELLGLVEHGNSADLTERIISTMGREFEWSEEIRANTPIRQACLSLLDEHQHHCKYNGFVYYGLMRLCEHQRLSAEGWKCQYSEDVLEFVNGTLLSANLKEIFAGLVYGRDPFFRLMNVGYQDAVACFLRPDEPEMLIEAIDQCSDFADGKIPNTDVEEIIFNEFLPAIGGKLPEGHCIAVFTL